VNAVQNQFDGGHFHFQTFDGFVSKISADGSTLVYSTFLGGSYDDFANAIAVDADGNAYVAGSTASADFPTMGSLYYSNLVANDSSGDANANFSDAFVTGFDPNGGLRFSTYLSGSTDDEASGIAVDKADDMYVTGDTASSDFPVPDPTYPLRLTGS